MSKGREEGLKAWVFSVLEGALLIPGPWFLDEDDIGLAIPS
jgi:hypothetical protein